MKKELLRKILDEIKSVRIIVLGDFCLDAYWFIDESMSEISIETNEVTRPVRKQKYTLGGAGNVTINLTAMGVKDVRAFGVIGVDPFGEEMVRIMHEAGINTKNLLVQKSDWDTHIFAKPYIQNRELNRIDFGNFNQLTDVTADLLISNVVNEAPGADIIIINQQVPSGIHSEYFRKRLLEVIKKFPDKKFITDSRNYNDYYDGTIRKMNYIEAARMCGKNMNHDEPVPDNESASFAQTLFDRFHKPLFITRGDRGSMVVEKSGISEIPGLMILSKVDTVGAGDSYLAGAAAALAAGNSMETAAQLGTFVAGVTVQKLFQTGTASYDEILAIGEDPDLIFSPGLADDIRQAKYMGTSEIEIVNKLQNKQTIGHAVFDHDGTISTLREGWELIMAPVMIKAILGDNYLTADEALFRKVRLRVDDFIDKTTGIQTLAQMKGLIDLIEEFGFVPVEKRFDEFGYKRIYNDELLKMVSVREEKYKNKELAIEDFTVKNAIPFLERLHDAGIKLYLASGTDVGDVKSEARSLGYDHLFEGRIFGAVGDIKKEAKKIVLDQILDIIEESSAGTVVTFGDGPVEMRETKKRNGIAVGIASNEVRRFGLNEKKRQRLIRAGADIIIPDFSQSSLLLELLNIS